MRIIVGKVMKSDDEVILGVDVSGKMLDYRLSGGGKSHSVPNDERGCQQLVKICRQSQVLKVVCEATGGYERLLTRTLEQNGIGFSVVNPSKVRNFGRAKGVMAKTDPIDAKLLRDYGEALRPARTTLPTEAREVLGKLLTRRSQLVQIQSIEKNHLKAPLVNDQTLASIQTLLTTLKAEIRSIEAQITRQLEATPAFQEKYALLRTFRGIGPICAAMLIAFVPELGSLTREKIAALVGVAPYNNESGESQGARSIYGGRGDVREVLYMATLTAARCNMAIKSHYRKFRSRGKKHKVTAVACMRKVIVTLNAMLRDGKSWEPLRFSTAKQDYQRAT